MRNNLRYIPVVLGCGVAMALVLLALIRWTGYRMNTVNIVLFCVIALCLVKAMEVTERFQYAVHVIQYGAVLLSFVICLFYSFFVSYGMSGNTLAGDLSLFTAIIHIVCLVYVFLSHRRRKKVQG